jgi:hypothetical protein
MLLNKAVLFAGALCLVIGTCAVSFAESNVIDSVSKYLNTNVKYSGYGSYEFGEVMKGRNGDGQPSTSISSGPIDHYWSHQVYAGLGFMAALNPQIELVAGIEGKMWNPYPSTATPGRGSVQQGYSLWLTGVYGTYSPFGGIGNSWLELTVGYFPYKYNPDVRNLGEYLFRTYTYPGLIFNSFDFPAIRLLGFMAHANIFDDFFGKIDSKLKSDLLITEEDQNWPFSDISISWLGSLNIKKVFEIGAGIDFANCISVNSFNTRPNVIGTIGNGNDYITGQDALGGNTTYDTTQFYTFQAVKPMGRINIDPKQIWGYQGQIFGQEDLKLYGEACIIGLQNYPYYYDNLSERMPIMLGFNVPTFKILDVLNIEVQHYSSRLPTSNLNQTQPINPVYCIAVPAGGVIYDNVAPVLQWKWSVYVKKTLVPRVAAILECAHDHYRLNYPDGNPVFSESLPDQGDWRWVFKIVGSL